jgi:radical SAM superfamily enzyme YgiQ (UPF0313 family)
LNVLLISTYELGRQPFGLASPAAWLKETGVAVTCFDLSVQRLPPEAVADADVVAFYVPMHTATRLALDVVEQVKRINPDAHLCFYGLYAPMNESFLRKLGAKTILGGEFEQGLVELVKRLFTEDQNSRREPQPEPLISLAKQSFHVPDRSGLPALRHYAQLCLGNGIRHTVGYTEASRGCKHLCRHCPIVPVYKGKFRVVQRDVVLEDIRRQVDAGALHITFGDPDFFNGPGHALEIVKALHRQFPNLTYDVTIKIEHLLKYAQHLSVLRDTGCLFVTSAVESVDDEVLAIFEKGHTREDFIRAVSLLREVGLTLNPTFVTFTPWTTVEGYLDLLRMILDLDLVENLSPIQCAIRLLIPAGSRLLELPSVRELIGEFDETLLAYPWKHQDWRVDSLYADVFNTVKKAQSNKETRSAIFKKVWELARQACEASVFDRLMVAELDRAFARAPIPYLNEPWYC